MRVLVIYEEVPEDTKTYVLDVTDDEWHSIERAHGMYINTEDCNGAELAACQTLSEMLVGEEELPKNTPISVRLLCLDKILISGFVL